MQQSPYRQYKVNQITTAGTGELVLLLCNGALRYLNLAQRAIELPDLTAANDNLIKAQEVVLELYAGLNYEAGGQLAVNLAELYLYMFRSLVQANIAKDADQVRHVIGLLDQLRSAWQSVVGGVVAPVGVGA